jgi:hypothetical protein
MNKNILVGLLIVVILLGGAAFFISNRSVNPPLQTGPTITTSTVGDTQSSQTSNITVDQLLNAHYVIKEWYAPNGFTLVNGHIEWPASAGNTSASFYIFKESGVVKKDYVAFGDLNGDGVPDAAIILWFNSGGNSNQPILAVLKNNNGQPEFLDSTDIPTPANLQIKDGVLVVNTLSGGPGIEKFKVTNGKLVVVK